MEFFLNALWAVIALVALGTWRVCWMRERRAGRRDPVRECAAVVCALVLLFFAVSLSDDLRSSLALMEESAGARRHLVMRDARHAMPDTSTHAAPQPLAAHAGWLATAPGFRFVSSELFHEVSCDFLATAVVSGRAPPQISL